MEYSWQFRCVKKILDSGVCGVHMYTLNLERSVTEIVRQLDLIKDPSENSSNSTRCLPWATTSKPRLSECVRPIFWVNRPKSYLARTTTWDDYPNGRWGDTRSPAFGDLADYHLSQKPFKKEELNQWGAPKTVAEVSNVFVKYLKGELNSLPWNEQALHPETSYIREKLIWLNENGLLTINSQPSVNGAKSSDKDFGWGPSKNGYVYQKAYLEFFCNEETGNKLLEELKKDEYASISYHFVGYKREEDFTNAEGTNALTWGVFPGREIVQPTIVDTYSFKVWKGEAFHLWNTWSRGYEDSDKESSELLASIRDNYYLVNVVDNDYINGDIFRVFNAILN